jgi:uncharacterized Fe-S cluster-containing radical SAM superfamily enzyme
MITDAELERALRELNVQERAAMWLYHNEYAAQGLGMKEFYKRLGKYEKRTVADMVAEILEAARRARGKGRA